jgi:hypothetical protein
MRYAIVVLGLTIVMTNAILLLLANGDRSWGAFGIGLLFGPMINATIAIVAVLLRPIVRKRTGASTVAYSLLATVGPVAAAVIDFVTISSMRLHGC